MSTFDFLDFLIACLYVVYFILPAYIANISGLAFGGTTPLDMGKNFVDKKRIIGDGVTWKGLIFGTIVGTVTGVLQSVLIGDLLHGLILGFLLSFGALIGDAVGSFIKRRLDINRGRPAPILDQLDFVIGALVLSSLFVKISLFTVAIAMLITLILHLASNMIAYAIGIKNVWY